MVSEIGLLIEELFCIKFASLGIDTDSVPVYSCDDLISCIKAVFWMIFSFNYFRLKVAGEGLLYYSCLVYLLCIVSLNSSVNFSYYFSASRCSL